jgi:hypothetical protein
MRERLWTWPSSGSSFAVPARITCEMLRLFGFFHQGDARQLFVHRGALHSCSAPLGVLLDLPGVICVLRMLGLKNGRIVPGRYYCGLLCQLAD